MKNFFELFKTILTASKEASRQAAREVRKLLHSPHDGGQYKDITSIIENAPAEYEKIAEDFRQENFVVAISVLYFLHNRENQPNFLFPWLFHLLRHENGNIRQAAVRMIEHEIGPLTYHLRFPNEKTGYHKLPPEEADHILFELFMNLHSLMAGFWKPTYNRHKYISSLPNGTYKSAQLIMSRLEDDCGKEYLDHLKNYGQNL